MSKRSMVCHVIVIANYTTQRAVATYIRDENIMENKKRHIESLYYVSISVISKRYDSLSDIAAYLIIKRIDSLFLISRCIKKKKNICYGSFMMIFK